MGLLTGIQVRCERCGLTEFFPDKEKFGDSESDFMNSKWDMVERKHVCPDCKATYDAYINKFFNEIFDK